MKVGHATTSTTSVIKKDEIGCTIKQVTSGIKDKASRAHVAAHLYERYDAVNVWKLVYKLMSNVRTLKAAHNFPFYNCPSYNPHNGYIMWGDFLF